LSQKTGSGLRDLLHIGLWTALVLAFVFLLLSRIAPPLLSSSDEQKIINRLRDQKAAILDEFEEAGSRLLAKHEALSGSEWPGSTQERFLFLKSLCADPELEGVAFYDHYIGDIGLWYGTVIDINPIFMEAQSLDPEAVTLRSTLLIRHKSSVYLITYNEMPSGDYVVFYRLLAFLPEFKARYLQEKHFLKKSLLAHCTIDYHDFREDISGINEFFSRNADEFIGQPDLQGQIQNIYFPFRNEKGRLMASVELASPSLSSRQTSQKETLLSVGYLFLITTLILLLLIQTRRLASPTERRVWVPLTILILLGGLRALFFPLSRLVKFRDLDMFSPAEAGLISIGDLTKSPADLFLSGLCLFLMSGFIFHFLRTGGGSRSPLGSAATRIPAAVGFCLAAFSSLWIFHVFLQRMVLNSSFSLLRVSARPAHVLVQLAVFFFFSAFILLICTAFRLSTSLVGGYRTMALALGGTYGIYLTAFWRDVPLPVLFLHGLLGSILYLAAITSSLSRRRQIQFLAFLAAVLMTYFTIDYAEDQKNRSILQNSIKNTVLSQEEWGRFYIRQSLPSIDKEIGRVIETLKSTRRHEFARELWRGTLLAKSNWYSSLELIASDGAIVSRFSLNIPEMYRPDFPLPEARDWRIISAKLSYWGKDKDFLIAYKDWFEEETRVGRTMIMLSVDYEMLPFLYSSNPYSELLRIASYPSLDRLDLGFAVFDLEGRLLFNPHNLSSGLPEPLLQDALAAEDSIWTEFVDKDRSFHTLMFPHKDRVYAIFLPQKTWLKYAVDFLKLFFMYSACLAVPALLVYAGTSRKNRTGLLWSFSNRVYIAFIVIALIPLLLFTMSTQNFFARVYAQKVTEEAESHANYAHRVFEDYVFQQQEGQVSLTIPPEELLIWISNAIAHDVHLYLDGNIYGTSLREFFEYGLLPDLIDGEIFYKIQYENNPLYTQTQKIGDYSFHTLTIPYYFQDNFLLISLPFPLEEQQVSRARADFLEFLFLLSVLFILIVLLFGRAAGATITSPIRKLLAGTKEVGLGNLEISIPYEHEDEMKTLVSGFNDMVLSLKRHQQEIADLGKKVAWAEMARKVAHEIKNPLTPIQLSAEHLLRVYAERPGEFEDALKESTSYIVTEVEHLRKIAQEFLETSKEAMLQKEDLDLKAILEETLEPYRKILTERIQFSVSFSGERFTFLGDQAKVKIVLRNILTNAIESIQDRGRINISLLSSESGLQLDIADTGRGLEPDILERIFEPYFSTKDVGTGLGLPIAKKIIKDHGGTILARPNEPQGLKIRISLPGT
jgi:signal transduction histidine kinase